MVVRLQKVVVVVVMEIGGKEGGPWAALIECALALVTHRRAACLGTMHKANTIDCLHGDRCHALPSMPGHPYASPAIVALPMHPSSGCVRMQQQASEPRP